MEAVIQPQCHRLQSSGTPIAFLLHCRHKPDSESCRELASTELGLLSIAQGTGIFHSLLDQNTAGSTQPEAATVGKFRDRLDKLIHTITDTTDSAIQMNPGFFSLGAKIRTFGYLDLFIFLEKFDYRHGTSNKNRKRKLREKPTRIQRYRRIHREFAEPTAPRKSNRTSHSRENLPPLPVAAQEARGVNCRSFSRSLNCDITSTRISLWRTLVTEPIRCSVIAMIGFRRSRSWRVSCHRRRQFALR